jgi:hypothetical protein
MFIATSLSLICTLPSWQMADVYCDITSTPLSASLSLICTLPSWQMAVYLSLKNTKGSAIFIPEPV